jgi:hypothetical protein
MNLAFVLLAEPQFPKGEEIVRAFSTFAPEGQRLRLRQDTEAPSSTVLEFEVGSGGRVFVAQMPLAVPAGEADAAVQFSMSALGTGWTLPVHKAHLMVTLQEGTPLPPIEALTSFTSLVAAVAQASGAVGVYWGNAGATHDAKFFMTLAKSQEIAPRLTLWTGLSVGREPDGRISLLSLGMKQLNLPDLLLVAPTSARGEVLETFFDLLTYIAKSGKPLPEGDTIGRTPDERMPVRYVPSPIDGCTMVWRVELR